MPHDWTRPLKVCARVMCGMSYCNSGCALPNEHFYKSIFASIRYADCLLKPLRAHRCVAAKVRNPLSGLPDVELSARCSLPRLSCDMPRPLRSVRLAQYPEILNF